MNKDQAGILFILITAFFVGCLSSNIHDDYEDIKIDNKYFSADVVNIIYRKNPKGVSRNARNEKKISLLINTLIKKNRLFFPHRSNKVIVTWFHTWPGDRRIDLISEAIEHVNLWHTSCNITKEMLISYGVPEDRITVIPLGVKLAVFSKATAEQKEAVRLKLALPKGKIVIGSFQKDGNGWGQGLTPKLVKGPDIFCDVVEELAKQLDVFILLTGPARGYVKQRLDKAGISYVHHFLDDPDAVAEYYKAIDLYIVSSRQEGGPKALLESMASGVPLISTKVGMAPDIIKDGENGFLCETEDVNGIVYKSMIILKDQQQREKIVNGGLDGICRFDWTSIAEQYELKLYQPLWIK